jgi:sec-independent protein translocase protein TatA
MTSPFLAFGMPAAPEWIFIGILALVLFGPKKLPELARGLGKALAELQKAKEDFQREITGVPPLPKIESPTGVQSTSSETKAPTESGTPLSGAVTGQRPNPPASGDIKA